MKKIVIIGAGIAGLSAAVYACQKGFEVEVYEMHSIPGGECTGWTRQGYHVDNCIHWLTGTSPNSGLYEVWQNVGAIKDVELYTAQAHQVRKIGDTEVHMYSDIEKLRRHLKEISPEDEERIDEYCNDIITTQCIDMPVDKPMEQMNVLDYIKLAKKMAPYGKIMKKFKHTTVEEHFNQFKHPALKEALKLGMENYPAYVPYFIMATVSSKNGAYPMGGSLAMAQRMAKRATNLGAKIYYNQEVKRIIVDKGKAIGIELVNGNMIEADYIVPANDLYVTIERLLEGKYTDDKIKKIYNQPEIYKAPTSVSIGVGVACDLSHRYETYVTPITPFKVLSKEIWEIGIKHYCHEKTFAPKGHSIMTIHLPAEYDEWKSLANDKETYKKVKDDIEKSISSALEEVYPEIKGKIEMITIATPLTYEKYCNAYKGAWMSFNANEKVKQFIHKGVLKDVKNMYMAGQWLQSPGGLPVAVATGKWAIQRICKQEKIKF